MECRGVLQDLIPDVGKLEFAWGPVEGWITDPGEHSLLDNPTSAMSIPSHYVKIVYTNAMS